MNPLIEKVVIEAATQETPRSDTASIIELSGGRLMVVYHKYERGKHSGKDHGICRIWSKVSQDRGRNWQDPRILVDVVKGDLNVQAPALLRLDSGQILLICLRAHDSSSSSMCMFSSNNEGENFSPLSPIWKRSAGFLLQGGVSNLIKLSSGRILLPFHGGSGPQYTQKNSAWCLISDDLGLNWKRSAAVVLPNRGAMEPTVTELNDGTLLMSLRTQLGGPYLSRSLDEGETWNEAVFSGLEGGESGTCLRRISGTDDIVLFWNNSKFNNKHHHFGERTPLTAAISSDNGYSWQVIGHIDEEPGVEFTNLDCTFISENEALLTYLYANPAWNRNEICLKSAIIPKIWFKNRENFNKLDLAENS